MPDAITPAQEHAPDRIPRRAWRALLAVAVLAVTVSGAAYTAVAISLGRMFRTLFRSSAAQGVPPAFLDRMLVGSHEGEWVVGAAYWALIAATVVLSAALLLDARWTDRALPAWCGMAACFAAMVVLGAERPELPDAAVAGAAWVAWIAAVAWAARRTEPREAPAPS